MQGTIDANYVNANAARLWLSRGRSRPFEFHLPCHEIIRSVNRIFQCDFLFFIMFPNLLKKFESCHWVTQNEPNFAIITQ
jgi:hypothetical protein